ncbi:MAG TPA: FAD-dependent oxidoreductase [Jatrophihabitantaceae bacterium]|jgi:sarcosine oxidase/L-pipecolate oxidase|nr:FAD-dependent oxidoreductase [Jatrophihabitantaceae bacterium]
MDAQIDIAVVGGGIIGLMAAAAVARRGKQVVVLEQHFPGTQEGSSAEHVRMWRTLYTEISHSQLAYRAGDLYATIESETSRKILHHHGLLNFGIETDYTPEGTLLTPVETMRTLNRPVRLLSRRDIEREYPFKNLPADYVGIYHADNAVIDVRSAFIAALQLCNKYHVRVLPRHRVRRLDNGDDGVGIVTDQTSLKANKVILAAGAYTNQILKPSFGIELDFLLWDMCFAYYKLDGSRGNYPMWFQFDQARNGHSNLFYGFPDVPFGRPGFVRVAVDWASHTFTDVDDRIYAPPRLDLEIVREFVLERLAGVDSAPVDAGRALMAHLPDNLSVLDYLPSTCQNNRNIVVCAAGWAFKFAPLFGDICARLALGLPVSDDISEFSISRPSVLRFGPVDDTVGGQQSRALKPVQDD